MSSQKSLYALLVGLNEYADPKMNLEGCVSDIEEMRMHLAAHFNNKQYAFYPKMLINEKATRINIINGFTHFETAKDGDICLFYFAGHGSRCKAPPEFWHLEVDKQLETLVCHDSRMPGGRDLMDKELSYLIWNAQQSKNIQFIAIVDSCHSGGITREDYSKIRALKESPAPPQSISDFLGVEHYIRSGDGKYTPPSGHHILLSASRNTETAKEVYVDGKPRGIFSYCLIDALKESRNQISYSDLINRIRLRIRNKVSEQTPQLEVTRSNDDKLVFLSDTSLVQTLPYYIAYDRSKKQWILDAGALHGIQSETDESVCVLQLEGLEGTEVLVTKVFSSYSTLSGTDKLNTSKSYKVKIKKMNRSPLSLAFDIDNDEAGQYLLKKQLDNYDTLNFVLVENPKEAQFLIQAKQDFFFLTTPDQVLKDPKTQSILPINQIQGVFKKIPDYSLPSAQLFIRGLEKISAWLRLLELSNPSSCIKDSDVSIRLYRSLMPGIETNDVPVEEVDWRKLTPLEYEKRDDLWHRPAFKLEIENTGQRKLWISLVYFSHNYGITNILIPKEELNSEDKISAKYIANGTTNFVIPVKIEEEYLDWGITKTRCYLKLFICTEDFSTNSFNQEALEGDPRNINEKRTLGFKGDIQLPDWRTKEICLEIHRPLESR